MLDTAFERSHPPNTKAGEVEPQERWAVSVVMVRETPNVINTQNRLFVLRAINRDAAQGKAVSLAQEEFPDHHLHTICAVFIAP